MTRIWMGVEKTGGQFLWTQSGEELSESSINWKSNEPSGGIDETRVQMVFGANYGYEDTLFRNPAMVLCELSACGKWLKMQISVSVKYIKNNATKVSLWSAK